MTIQRTMLVLLLVALLFHPTVVAASTSPHPRPSWLSHVDDVMLQKYQHIAHQRHEEAIATALRHYNTDQAEDETPGEDQDIVQNIEFDKYRVVLNNDQEHNPQERQHQPNQLPDFHPQLGDRPNVFVTKAETPLFSKDECRDVIAMAEAHFANQEWPRLPSGQYMIQGFWIKDVPPVREWFVQMCRRRLFPLLQRQFPEFLSDDKDAIDAALQNLVVDQAYLFKYVPQPGLRTEIHTDAGCLSFTVALNPKDDYQGGGTWVDGLVQEEEENGGRDHDDDRGHDAMTIEMDVGQCTVRPGGIRHCGNPITQGTRYIIGGFCMSPKRVETVRQLLNNNHNNREYMQNDQTDKNEEQYSDETTEREALECAIALNPHFEGPYPTLASIYEKQDGSSSTRAQQVLEDCLKLANPKSTTAAYYLGSIHYHKGNYDKAQEYMRLCLSVDPKDGDAMATMAQAHAHLGQTREERNMYQQIITTPGVSKRTLSIAYCNLGNFMDSDSDSDLQQEIEYYLKSLEYDPLNMAALQSLGSAFATQQDWDKAIACFRKVVDHEYDNGTDNPQALVNLYRVATRKMKENMGAASTGQAQVMEQLGNLIGKNNVERLMAMQQQQQQQQQQR